MGSPQYKDGSSIAALELNIASGSLWQQSTGDVYGLHTQMVRIASNLASN